jgi:hypothetical protein
LEPSKEILAVPVIILSLDSQLNIYYLVNILKTAEVSGFAAEMACKRKHSKYNNLFGC